MTWHFAALNWLIHTAVGGSLILLIGTVAVCCCRQPIRRVRVIELSLIGLLLVPWLQFVPGLPLLSIGWLNFEPASALPQTPVTMVEPDAMTAPDDPPAAPATRVQVRPGPTLPRADFREPKPAPAATDDRPVPSPALSVAAPPPSVRSDVWVWLVLAGYAGIAGLLLIRILVGLVLLVRLRRHAYPVPQAVAELFHEIAGDAGRRVNLLANDSIDLPLTFPGWKSVILLPGELCRTGDPAALRYGLAHEWSHIQGWDVWRWYLANLAQLLFYYQPLFWWLRWQLRLCQDYLADARAVEQAAAAEDYADYLVGLARKVQAVPSAALSIGGRRSNLYRRITMLLQSHTPLQRRCRASWSIGATLIALVVLAVSAGVRMDIGASAEDKKSDPMKEDPKESSRGRPATQARPDGSGDPLPAGALLRIGTLRAQHSLPWFFTFPIVFSPDGTMLAAPADDGTVRLWDSATGKDIRRLLGHGRRVYDLAFSADGKMIVSGGEDEAIRFWEVATGKELRCFKGHTPHPLTVCMTTDGKIMVSCSGHDIRIWDVVRGEVIRRIAAPKGNTVWSAVLSPDGKTIAAQYHEGPVRLWETATGKELDQFKASQTNRHHPRFLPDGKTLLTWGEDNTLTLWDLATGKELRQIKHVRIPIAVSRDGSFCATASGGFTWSRLYDDAPIYLWDLKTGKEIRKLKGHLDGICSLAIAPDGKTLVSFGSDHMLRRWDVSTGKELDPAEGHQHALTNIAFSPDGKLLASGSADRTVRLWDPITGKQLQRFQTDRELVQGIAFAKDGKTLLSQHEVLYPGSENWPTEDKALRRVHLWDVSAAKERHHFDIPKALIDTVAFSPAGGMIAMLQGDSVRLFEAETGKELGRLKSDDLRETNSMAFSADGKLLATTTGNAFGEIRGQPSDSLCVWDVASRKKVWCSTLFQMFSCVAFSPDGKILATGGKPVSMWDAATGKNLCELEGGEGPLAFSTDGKSEGCLAFSPDGKMLATCGKGGAVLLWDVGARKLHRRFEGHDVSCMAFSPDGRLLATGGEDTLVMIWDVMAKEAPKEPAKDKPAAVRIPVQDSSADIQAEAIQPAGAPMLVTVVWSNKGKESIWWWTGGPALYPNAREFAARITDDNGKVRESVTMANGQYPMGSGMNQELKSGDSVTLPAALDPLPAGSYKIEVSTNPLGAGPWSAGVQITIKDDPQLLQKREQDILEKARKGEPFAQFVAAVYPAKRISAALLKDLLSDDKAVAIAAAHTLSSCRTMPADSGAVISKAMEKHLTAEVKKHNRDTNLVFYLAMVAANVGSEDALPAVIALAHTSELGDETRERAVSLLGVFKQEAATRELHGFLKDKKLLIRFMAARLLADRKDPAAIEALIEGAGDKLCDSRSFAYESLAKFPNDPRAEAAIKEGLKDPDMYIREQAKRALKELRQNQRLPGKEKPPEPAKPKPEHEKEVHIGTIDPKWAAHVGKLFDDAQIPNLIEGSVIYGIMVPPEKKNQANQLLKTDAAKHGYIVGQGWPGYQEPFCEFRWP